jgi:DNA (cytosine-5)-methyltransferase 1
MAKTKAVLSAGGACGVKAVRGPFVRLSPHADHCTDVPSLMAMLRGSRGPRAIDLFCGAGGLSLGLRDAGFDVVMGIDHDREAVETHAALFAGLSAAWDLADPAVIDQIAAIVREGRVTLVAGGPPCQPFSSAGKGLIRHLVATGRRHHRDERADLWKSFLGVIEKSMPPAVLMENVPDIALDPTMGILRTMVETLETLGYSVATQLIETWRYGVPQFRERFFLVALRGASNFEWPPPSSERVTVDNAIGDLPEVDGGERPAGGAEGWWRYRQPRSRFQKRAREGVPTADQDKIFDHITRPVRPDDRVVFTQMDSKTRYTDIPAELRRYRDDIYTDKYTRLDAHDLSRTITAHIAKDGYWYIHPSQPRTLTVREAARIQTFRDNVRFAGPPSSAFRQIGNAVPPLMGEHLGAAILNALNHNGRPSRATSTREVSKLIGDWFATLKGSRVPWLRAQGRWQVILAEQLFDRVRSELGVRAWPMVEHLSTPKTTLAKAKDLTEIAGYVGRDGTVEQILENARYFIADTAALKSFAGIEKAPYMDSTTAALAVWVVPGQETLPVVVGSTVLRVAARLVGNDVDSRNRSTDGRIAIARLIGTGDGSTRAFLGLTELGRTLCRPRNPVCHECPLLSSCSTGSAHLRRRPRLF